MVEMSVTGAEAKPQAATTAGQKKADFAQDAAELVLFGPVGKVMIDNKEEMGKTMVGAVRSVGDTLEIHDASDALELMTLGVGGKYIKDNASDIAEATKSGFGDMFKVESLGDFAELAILGPIGRGIFNSVKNFFGGKA